jgi:N-acetylglucosamine malate deacetylase 1
MHLLACGAHADDVEISCGGTLALATSLGHKVSILDLTRGELGSNGDVESRAREAAAAAEVLGVSVRENAGLPDGHLNASDQEQRRVLVGCLRRLAPDLLLIPPAETRHPDHGQTHHLIKDAAFLAGLHRYEAEGEPGRAGGIYQYMEQQIFDPTLYVDVSSVIELKRQSLLCYRSQFEREPGSAPTIINDSGFLDWIISRNRHFGGRAGCEYAEAFAGTTALLLDDPAEMLGSLRKEGQ